MIININQIHFINSSLLNILSTRQTQTKTDELMSKIFLIRHGQASFGKQNYDQLSELGSKQAYWLGQHLKDIGIQPSRIITGSLNRHKQTAASLCEGMKLNCDIEEHIGWNEFDFHAIVYALLRKHPEFTPKTNQPKAFFSLLRKAMTAWSDNTLTGSLPESWSDFENRVYEAMLFSKNKEAKNILVISSGGAISMALKQLLNIENSTMIDLNLQTRNTSLSEIYFNENQSHLCSFNAVPHLETAERRTHITYA